MKAFRITALRFLVGFLIGASLILISELIGFRQSDFGDRGLQTPAIEVSEVKAAIEKATIPDRIAAPKGSSALPSPPTTKEIAKDKNWRRLMETNEHINEMMKFAEDNGRLGDFEKLHGPIYLRPLGMQIEEFKAIAKNQEFPWQLADDFSKYTMAVNRASRLSISDGNFLFFAYRGANDRLEVILGKQSTSSLVPDSDGLIQYLESQLEFEFDQQSQPQQQSLLDEVRRWKDHVQLGLTYKLWDRLQSDLPSLIERQGHQKNVSACLAKYVDRVQTLFVFDRFENPKLDAICQEIIDRSESAKQRVLDVVR